MKHKLNIFIMNEETLEDAMCDNPECGDNRGVETKVLKCRAAEKRLLKTPCKTCPTMPKRSKAKAKSLNSRGVANKANKVLKARKREMGKKRVNRRIERRK